MVAAITPAHPKQALCAVGVCVWGGGGEGGRCECVCVYVCVGGGGVRRLVRRDRGEN